MSVLLTGGAGYIGAVTARWLKSLGEQVVILDDFRRGHRAATVGFDVAEVDVGDTQAVMRAIEDYSVGSVVHLAAYKAVGESMERPEIYFRNNVGGSLGLLDAMSKTGVEHLVFSSTCAVYGTPERLPVTESAPLGPESPYAESKLAVEQMLDWFDRCYGIRSVSLRYFNAAGAWEDGSLGEYPDNAINLIPVILKAALGEVEAVDIYGTDYETVDGTGVRDYIHVLDLAAAHHRALEYLRDGGESVSLNVGTGIGASVLEIIKVVEDVTGRSVPRKLVDRRPGDPAASWADPRRAEETLGWKARRDLREIITSAWRWQSTHPSGLDEAI